MVIYVDILFVVNFFITYLLLLFTSLMLKGRSNTARFLLASAFGGVYALVILIDDLSFLVTFLGKIAASFIIVLIAFGFKRLFVYLKSVIVFYFSNMLFLGIITALLFAFKPQGITLSNSVVYFDISAKTLLICAIIAYGISYAVVKIYNHSIGKSEIYQITIYKENSAYNLFAFADSGNKLKEPFSDFPVIIADRSKIDVKTERVIPYNTVGGEGMLKAFKPDKVVISNGKNSFETERVYIALSAVESKEFSAIINPELLNI